MELIKSQLDSLRQWLTKMEDRISRINKDCSLDDQMNHLTELENDITQQQGVVDGLKGTARLIEDDNSESAYAQVEDDLTALNERWSHICQWRHNRRQNLEALALLLKDLTDNYKKLVSWLGETEITLKQMEACSASELGEVLDRIQKLRFLKMEMDNKQTKLNTLQKSIQDLDDGSGVPPECVKLMEKLEYLQDRWEAVAQIMEVQNQRVRIF